MIRSRSTAQNSLGFGISLSLFAAGSLLRPSCPYPTPGSSLVLHPTPYGCVGLRTWTGDRRRLVRIVNKITNY